MLLLKLPGLSLLAWMGFTFFAGDASGVVVYRVGTPFSAAEKDSLQDLGIDFREIDWSFSALEQGLELDSLSTGSLQPYFFDEDENMARTVSNRGGWISISVYGRGNTLVAQVLVDGDPSTAYVWPEAVDNPARITLDLGGQFLVKKVRFHPQAENPGRFLESFGIGVGNDLRSTACGQCVAYLPLANIQKPGGVAPMELISENTDPEVTVLLEPPDGLETRFLQLDIRRVTTKAIELAELEVYGGGFVSQAILCIGHHPAGEPGQLGSDHLVGPAGSQRPDRDPYPHRHRPPAGYLLGGPPRTARQHKIPPGRWKPERQELQSELRPAPGCVQAHR